MVLQVSAGILIIILKHNEWSCPSSNAILYQQQFGAGFNHLKQDYNSHSTDNWCWESTFPRFTEKKPSTLLTGKYCHPDFLSLILLISSVMLYLSAPGTAHKTCSRVVQQLAAKHILTLQLPIYQLVFLPSTKLSCTLYCNGFSLMF